MLNGLAGKRPRLEKVAALARGRAVMRAVLRPFLAGVSDAGSWVEPARRGWRGSCPARRGGSLSFAPVDLRPDDLRGAELEDKGNRIVQDDAAVPRLDAPDRHYVGTVG